MDKLKVNILRTLHYYDLFDFPFTKEELLDNLVVDPINQYLAIDRHIFRNVLQELIFEGKISEEENLYFLPDREHLPSLRRRHENISLKKIKKTQSIVRVLAALPYIRAVFASGSLGLRNTDHESDLDVFIITKSGRIWTARIVEIIFTVFLGVRRKSTHKISPDKLCPNHYVTGSSLEIPEHNIFRARIYKHLLPLYMADKMLLGNFKQKNSWIANYVYRWSTNFDFLIQPGSFSRGIKKIGELIFNTSIGDEIEKLAQWYQIRRIVRNPKTKEPHGRIEFNDQRLEFHPDSIEEDILKQYKDRIDALGLQV